MNEIWKDIKGFEGVYQISNKGNVRSVDRVQTNSKGVVVCYKGKRLKPQPNSNGYLRVELKTKKKVERWFVHRLVATHFVENPFKSIRECGKHGFEPSCVCQCCKGERKTHKGFAWKYGKGANNG